MSRLHKYGEQENSDSSSESDIENYLQPIDQIDLDSPFFSINEKNSAPTKTNDNNPTSDSESNHEDEQEAINANSIFQNIAEYTKKMEEAKRQVEEYTIKSQHKDKQTDIYNLLSKKEQGINFTITPDPTDSSNSDTDSQEDIWEEVNQEDKQQKMIPKDNLEIVVDMPQSVKHKSGDELLASIKRKINNIRKKNQISIHKVHLLCWLAHGLHINAVINSNKIQSRALSLLPSKRYTSNKLNMKFLEELLEWYSSSIINVSKTYPTMLSLATLLEAQMDRLEVFDAKMLVYIFVAILRSLGVECRLVLNFLVEPMRPPKNELHSLSQNNDKKNESPKRHTKSTSEAAANAKVLKGSKVRSKSTIEVSNQDKISTRQTTSSFKVDSHVNQPKRPKSKVENTVAPNKTNIKARNSQESPTEERFYNLRSRDRLNNSDGSIKEDSNISPRNTKKKINNKRTILQLNGADDIASVDKAGIDVNQPKETISKVQNTVDPNSINTKSTFVKSHKVIEEHDETRFYNFRSRGRNNSDGSVKKGNNNSPKNTKKKTNNKRTISQLDGADSDSDDEVFVKKVSARLLKKQNLGRTPFGNKNSPQSTPSTSGSNKRTRNFVNEAISPTRNNSRPKKQKKLEIQEANIWVEVFLETEQKWMTVDVINGQLNCIEEIYENFTKPATYIIVFNNNNTVKDLTKKYCPKFNTATRKHRITSKWWEATLKPFKPKVNKKEKKEDEELERQQLDQPLPIYISEYKNHPLYVLKRHLLKYEAIYPPDAPILGFVRKEEVYPRQCVYRLHPRDIWYKQAKVVKPREKAYKIVKGRPRWDKLSRKIVIDPTEDIFGPWQVEDYDPPTAENGIVPRNAYGNVELFKMSMLPKKTVHLQLPGLNKVAKQMNIDCAPAIVGFEFSNGWLHPAYDGFVVCEEFEDILIAAWELSEDELDRKEEERIEKRVYGNWKKLIKGLLIRERLNAKYQFNKKKNPAEENLNEHCKKQKIDKE